MKYLAFKLQIAGTVITQNISFISKDDPPKRFDKFDIKWFLKYLMILEKTTIAGKLFCPVASWSLVSKDRFYNEEMVLTRFFFLLYLKITNHET
jgi:hypothetical protein